MIRWMLNIAYIAALVFFSPWLVFSAITKGKYREGFAAKLFGCAPQLDRLGRTPGNDTRRVWIHAVSVGEVNLIAPILKGLKQAFPQYEFVISSTSKTGFQLAKRKFPEHVVFYAPLDFTWSVRRAFRRIQPDVLALVELELWPNLLWEAEKLGVPVVVFNGRLSEHSFRNYRWVRWLMRRVVRPLSLVLTQDEQSAAHFRELGVPSERIHDVGSLKYDGAETDRQNEKTQRLKRLWNLTDSDTVFLAGSTQAPEESLALRTFLELSPTHPDLRLILVPRHPERFDEVAGILSQSDVSWIRRSQLGSADGDSTVDSDVVNHSEKVLLVDTVGELAAWWGTASIGFVGGSLQNKRGGQNMVEAAAFGTAVCFGPNTWNFRDIVRTMLDQQAAVVVRNGDELTRFVERCLNDAAFREQLGQNAAQLVVRQQGALQKSVELFRASITD